MNSNFKFTVTEILKFERSELDEGYFKKLNGEETEVKTTEDFRNRIKEEIEANFVYSSNHKFAMEAHDKLIEQINLKLSEAFLKSWLIAINKEITVDQIEKDFDAFSSDLKSKLLKDVMI